MKTIEQLNAHFEKLGEKMKVHTPITYMGAFLWCFDAPFLNAFVYYMETWDCDTQTAHFYASQYAYWWDLQVPEDPCNKGNWDTASNKLLWKSRSGNEYRLEWFNGGIEVEASYPEDSNLASSFEMLEEAQEEGIMPPPAVPVGYTAYVKNVKKFTSRT